MPNHNYQNPSASGTALDATSPLRLCRKWVSPIVDAAEPDVVGPDEWNADHDFIVSNDQVLLGNIAGTAQSAQELTAAQVRTLLNVEDGATADQSAAEILAALLTVDGPGSGLDADLLDGNSSAFFATASGLSDHLSDTSDAHDASAISFSATGNIVATDVQAAIAELDTEKLAAASYTAADVLSKLLTVDGSGSGLDADLLDGQSSAAFQPAGSYQTADATLTALAAYNTNGLLTQTAADTFVGRTITGTANEVQVTDGGGVAGNPTIGLPDDVTISNDLTVGSDVLLPSGGIINWDGGNVTLTQSNNLLTCSDDFALDGGWLKLSSSSAVEWDNGTCKIEENSGDLRILADVVRLQKDQAAETSMQCVNDDEGGVASFFLASGSAAQANMQAHHAGAITRFYTDAGAFEIGSQTFIRFITDNAGSDHNALVLNQDGSATFGGDVILDNVPGSAGASGTLYVDGSGFIKLSP